MRILRPSEYEQLRGGARTLENQTRSDALLLTGLRYVEAQRLRSNPDWVDGRFVHLPEFAQRKAKRKQKERWVRLSSKGASLLPYFFKTKVLPTWKGWTQNMERWAGNSGLVSQTDFEDSRNQMNEYPNLDLKSAWKIDAQYLTRDFGISRHSQAGLEIT